MGGGRKKRKFGGGGGGGGLLPYAEAALEAERALGIRPSPGSSGASPLEAAAKRALKKNKASVKEAWREVFPDEDSFDASGKPSESLEQFFASLEGDAATKAVLVEEVSAITKAIPECLEVWEEVSSSESAGTSEPAQHEHSFLLSFLVSMADEYSSAVEDGGAPSAGGHDANRSWCIDEVVKIRKVSDETERAWKEVCREKGGGVNDPRRQTVSLLQRYIDAHGSSVNSAEKGDTYAGGSSKSAPEAGSRDEWSKRDWGLAVSRAKRSNPACQEMWDRYCDAEAGGTRDPSKHELEFLRYFLETVWEAKSSTAADEVDPREEAAQKKELVGALKREQRMSSECRQAWNAFCDAEGGGTKNPTLHDSAFIRHFLQDVWARVTPEEDDPGANGDSMPSRSPPRDREPARNGAWEARGAASDPGCCKVFIGNLAFEAHQGEGELHEIMSSVGPVEELALPTANGKSKGFGFCNYKDAQDARDAVDRLNGTQFMGRRLRLNIAERPNKKNTGRNPEVSGMRESFQAVVDRVRNCPTEVWHEFCDTNSEGKQYNPERHPLEFLQSFLAAHGQDDAQGDAEQDAAMGEDATEIARPWGAPQDEHGEEPSHKRQRTERWERNRPADRLPPPPPPPGARGRYGRYAPQSYEPVAAWDAPPQPLGRPPKRERGGNHREYEERLRENQRGPRRAQGSGARSQQDNAPPQPPDYPPPEEASIEELSQECNTIADWKAAQNRIFGKLSPLPKDWIRIWSKSKGRIYFHNCRTNQAQFVEPK